MTRSDDGRADFDRTRLDQTVLAIPLIEELAERPLEFEVDVIIDLNLLYPKGLDSAKRRAERLVKQVIGKEKARDHSWGVDKVKSDLCPQYLFARLTKGEIQEVVQRDAGGLRGQSARSIYKIWPDFEVRAKLIKSIATVKADAAKAAFSALGEGVVWAVIDSGIDGDHPHFREHKNLELQAPLSHMDFTQRASVLKKPRDEFGHGTHVAGIIAGEVPAGGKSQAWVATRERDEAGDAFYRSWQLKEISGVAPKCKLLSLRVLNEDGTGPVSNLIAAISYVLKVNDYGRWQRINGVNLSVGYPFDAEWFACGQSPLCVEVDRLVRSGVVVVAAAGNTGYGSIQSEAGVVKMGLDLSINDPGNAELAITVGATHREKPHLYGVAYFSSKGPTGDGRLKPDLVAPGEKIISCAAGREKDKIVKALQRQGDTGKGFDYRDESGTSMAAPHVSGAIAAFLSIRREFIGRPERLKEIFLSTAIDLKRERYFQGNGLVDLMRAIQSV